MIERTMIIVIIKTKKKLTETREFDGGIAKERQNSKNYYTHTNGRIYDEVINTHTYYDFKREAHAGYSLADPKRNK